MSRTYHVYIMTNLHRTLYVGVTSNLQQRVIQHKTKALPGFTARYDLDRLVYCEAFQDVQSALAAEKRIKGWLRSRKVALVESVNPGWVDLSGDLGLDD